MATCNPDMPVSRIAGRDVINKRFVTEETGGEVLMVGTEGAAAQGVVQSQSIPTNGSLTQRTIVDGDPVPVCKGGDPLVESGALVSDGDVVMSDNVGRAITYVAGAGNYALGRVINGTSAGAAGEDLCIELFAEPQLTLDLT